TKDGVVAHVAYSPSVAYPSGHALSGWLVALVLAQLEPSEGAQLMHCAAEIGWDRVVVGVHYQTDVIASRTVAQLVFDRLMSDPDFQEQLTRVRKAEWSTPRDAAEGRRPN
ncbi:MAG: phosphatase PAP2 family protein, partial [Chthoniobacterales bacterium]|nr:phosphatase PAP2 family protein [Chthoniobacterales bacterium]